MNLINDIEYLSKLLDNNMDKNVILILNQLLEIYMDLKLGDNYKYLLYYEPELTFEETVKIMKEQLGEFKKSSLASFKNINNNCIKKFDKDIISTFSIDVKYETYCSLNDAKTIIFDFFKQLDKSLLKTVEECLDDEALKFRYKNVDTSTGFAIYNTYTNNKFIYITTPNSFDINSMSIIVHEITHIIAFLKDYHFYQTNMNLFSELPSCSLEILFIKYFEKISKHDSICEISENLYEVISSAKKLKRHLSIDNIKYFYGILYGFYTVDRLMKNEIDLKYIYNLMENISSNNYLETLTKFSNLKEFESCDFLSNDINKVKQYFL